MTRPWRRRRGESAPAFEAFTAYRDLGIGRSLHKVARELSKSATLLKRWSARWDWVDRCAAWDSHVDDRRLAASLDEVEERARRHVAEGRQMQVLALRRMRAVDDPEQEMTLHLAQRYMDVGVRLERLAAGESEGRLEVRLVDSALKTLIGILDQEITDPAVRRRLRERFGRVLESVERGNGAGAQ